MRKNRSKDILDLFIRNSKSDYSVEELSDSFGVSPRMIRNYIRQLNEGSETILFENGRLRLNPEYERQTDGDHPDLSPEERVSVIISKLLTDESDTDVFDLAEELFVSEATIEADLKKVRRRIERFDLTLVSENGRLCIKGSEKNKRSLTSYMITNTRYKGFMFNDSRRFLNDEYQISFIKDNLITIFNECYFFYNDYSLNNIILHIIITIDRLKNDCAIQETQFNINISEIEQQAADRISAFLEENYDIAISQSERNNIASFLSCNLATLDYRMINPDNIETYIPHRTIELVRYILDKVSDYYLLDGFDDVFFARFSLHIDNLLKRQQAHYSVHNPMQMDIRLSYPLIFDIAIYAASLIEEKTSYRINQDEISLIALHIGSFIESNDSNRNKVSAIYIYADYHQFYQQNITALHNRFEKEMNLLYTVSMNDYADIPVRPDLLISEVFIDGAILVSPFITSKQLDQIASGIERISKEKESEHFIASFKEMFTEDLFFLNIHGEDEFDVITRLTDRLKKMGYVDDSFRDSVISRERLSSTAFLQNVAIPHAISQNVSRSFISFVCYDSRQNWGNGSVSLVVLFGISYADRKNFRSVFSQIVKLFESQNNILSLSRCRTYEEIIQRISELLAE